MKTRTTSSTIKINFDDCVKATLSALNYQDYIAAIDRIKNLETEVKRMKKSVEEAFLILGRQWDYLQILKVEMREEEKNGY